MKGMFFNGQYMKLFNSYFYYHLNLDFVLDGNVSQKNKNKWRTFKKKKWSKLSVFRHELYDDWGFFPAVFELRHTKVASLKFPASDFNCDLYQIFF